ncbi:MAG: ATP-dependent zinc metalloprotease FtsH [Haliscomenobacter sp.]
MADTEQKRSTWSPRGGWIWWIYLLLAASILFQWRGKAFFRPAEISWKVFDREMLQKGVVSRLDVVNSETVEVYIRASALGKGYFEKIDSATTGPHYTFLIGSAEVFERQLLEAQSGVEAAARVDVRYVRRSNLWKDVLLWVFPILMIVGLWTFLLRRSGPANTGGVNPFDFGKSRAAEFDGAHHPVVNFSDVAGLEEAKEEVREIVDFLKNPDYYTRLGARIPRGVILVGPPGTGKTLMARAVAGEAKVPFFSISGSEFVEMFVGVGASRVRDLFRKAKERAPSIVFIDEIDAIGRARGAAFSLRTNDERESTLNQLLTEMDGFDKNTNVIVIAATNRADILDRALLRPGRFDRHIYLELPNIQERKSIFGVHLRPLQLAGDLDIDILAAQTPGFSGADIANICNEAALIAARKGKSSVAMQDFFDATDRIIAGLEKKSKIISAAERKIIAYHEAGHAVVSWRLPFADKLLKVSIVPRGKSLGAAWYLPEERQIYTKAQFMDRICAGLGGRVAEEVVFEEATSGALDDLEKITKQAYTMVAYYGLDEALGQVSYYDSTGASEQSLQKPYSEATAQLIDTEVRRLLDEAYQRTRKVLEENRDALEQVAQLLLQREVVLASDLEHILGEKTN